jgi:cobalt-zinc-cadmium efflux system outer membrane protein
MKRCASLLLLAAGCATRVDDPVLLRLRQEQSEPAGAPREEEQAPLVPVHGPARSGQALDLDAALGWARLARPELAAAHAAVAAAQARAEGSGRFPNPRLIARAEGAPLEGGTDAEADLLAGVSQPLPLSDRRAAAQSLAAAELERSRARYDVAEREVAAQVVRAFATALFAQEAAARRHELAQETAALRAPIEARIAAGDATASERAHAALALHDARAAEQAAERVAALARVELAAAIGTPDAVPERVVGELDALLALPLLEELSARLADHPALRAARADAQVAAAALELAREERVPDLDVDLLYRRLGAEEANAFDVGLSIPLRAWDRGTAAIDAARADEQAARALALASERDLAAALRSGHARLAAALAARETLRREVLPLHDEVVRIEEARVAAGDARPEVAAAARHARTLTELARLDATQAALQAWAELRSLVPPDDAR